MRIVLREIDKKDEKKAMHFAVKGMHLDRYVSGKTAMKIYARYFWYMEMDRATQCIAAYIDGILAGILLADMKGEEHPYRRWFRRAYVAVIQWVLNRFFHGSSGAYDAANQEMFSAYTAGTAPDGEVIFLAANPDQRIKGVGTLLLNELEKREKGKTIYLYTDDGCTWQFYEHRGFARVGEKAVSMDMDGENVPIQCLLYSKKLNPDEEYQAGLQPDVVMKPWHFSEKDMDDHQLNVLRTEREAEKSKARWVIAIAVVAIAVGLLIALAVIIPQLLSVLSNVNGILDNTNDIMTDVKQTTDSINSIDFDGLNGVIENLREAAGNLKEATSVFGLFG